MAHRPVTPAVTGRGWGRGSRLWAGTRAPRAQGACGRSPGLWCGAADGQGVSRNPTVSAGVEQGLEERGPWGQGRWEEDEWHRQEELSEAAACRGRPASTGRAPVPGVARTLQTALLPGGLAAWSVSPRGVGAMGPVAFPVLPRHGPRHPRHPAPTRTGNWPVASSRRAVCTVRAASGGSCPFSPCGPVVGLELEGPSGSGEQGGWGQGPALIRRGQA